MNAVGLRGAISGFFFKTSGSGTINLYKQTQTPKLMTCELMRAVLLVPPPHPFSTMQKKLYGYINILGHHIKWI